MRRFLTGCTSSASTAAHGFAHFPACHPGVPTLRALPLTCVRLVLRARRFARHPMKTGLDITYGPRKVRYASVFGIIGHDLGHCNSNMMLCLGLCCGCRGGATMRSAAAAKLPQISGQRAGASSSSRGWGSATRTFWTCNWRTRSRTPPPPLCPARLTVLTPHLSIRFVLSICWRRTIRFELWRVLHFPGGQALGNVPYFVALDRRRQKVILSIRGSASVQVRPPPLAGS